MKKDDFLKFLDEEDVKDAILKIVSERLNDTTEIPRQGFPQNDSDDEKNTPPQTKIEVKTGIEQSEKTAENSLHENSECQTRLEKSNDSISALKNEIEALKAEIAELEAQRDEFGIEIADLQANLGISEEKNSRLKTEADALKKENNRLKSLYEGLEKPYNIFLSLSNKTKQQMEYVFEKDDLISFLASGFDWQNIVALLHIAQNKIREREKEDISAIAKLFKFFFQAYCTKSMEQPYELIEPKTGEKYDSDLHSIIGTNTDGRISSVLLCGCKNAKNNRIIEKALVEVE